MPNVIYVNIEKGKLSIFNGLDPNFNNINILKIYTLYYRETDCYHFPLKTFLNIYIPNTTLYYNIIFLMFCIQQQKPEQTQLYFLTKDISKLYMNSFHNLFSLCFMQNHVLPKT
jgi:hypothetical protein